MVMDKITLACAIAAVLLTYVSLQVTARPYDVMPTRSSTQPMPQELRDVFVEAEKTLDEPFLQEAPKASVPQVAQNISVPQAVQDVIHELGFHERIRRSLDNNPCYKPRSFTQYKGYYTVECYRISPTGCGHNIPKYATRLCRSLYTSYRGLPIVTDCACA